MGYRLSWKEQKALLKKGQAGFVLAECLIAIGILAMIMTMAVMATTHISWGPTQLDAETERVVGYIKRLQYVNMAGFQQEEGRPPTLEIRRQSITFVDYLPHGESYRMALNQPIICETSRLVLGFSSMGKPAGDTTIVLRDTLTGDMNQIYIAVQTGRVRWVPLKRKGRFIPEESG
ncbi:MAG: hypothetical protein HUJ84_02450 [Veillonella sp.]|nr:hypothetical protein [Veillonella sp.]